jgi:hypothetical protein
MFIALFSQHEFYVRRWGGIDVMMKSSYEEIHERKTIVILKKNPCYKKLSLLGYNRVSPLKSTDISEEHVASIFRVEAAQAISMEAGGK